MRSLTTLPLLLTIIICGYAVTTTTSSLSLPINSEATGFETGFSNFTNVYVFVTTEYVACSNVTLSITLETSLYPHSGGKKGSVKIDLPNPLKRYDTALFKYSTRLGVDYIQAPFCYLCITPGKYVDEDYFLWYIESVTVVVSSPSSSGYSSYQSCSHFPIEKEISRFGTYFMILDQCKKPDTLNIEGNVWELADHLHS